MVWGYQAEATAKFPTPAVPIEDDYPNDAAYQQALENFMTQQLVVMAHCQRWIKCEEVEDHRQEAKVVKAAELKKKERAEVAAARKCTEVMKGKRPEVSLPVGSADSSKGSKASGSCQVVELEVEPLSDLEWGACCAQKSECSVFPFWQTGVFDLHW